MGWRMAKIDLDFVNEYRDRHGKTRRYFRRGGKNVGPLPGDVGSEQFMAAYAAYLGNRAVKSSAPVPASHGDSLAKLAADYYGHPWFTQRKPNTRKLYRKALDAVVAKHGHRSVSVMSVENAEKIIHTIGADRPAMANVTRAVMRQVMKLAVKRKMRPDNPFKEIEAFEVGVHHTWTDAELQRYERRWPIGTRQRLAYALLLYTDQRISDVVKMHRSHVAGGLIHVEAQEKTGAELWLPIHPELERAMKAYPANGLMLIGKDTGQPIKPAALSELIRKAVRDAGLPRRCVAHGLRKALQRILAEHGASEKECQAMSGHASSKETARYTRAAEQKRLAIAAMKRLPNRLWETA